MEKERALGVYARLLGYPDNHYIQVAEMLYLIIGTEMPEIASCVSKFGQFVESCDETELEEAYTRTFDVNPACALEIGWHLFGEDYVRGQFLVRMREELKKYEIPETTELPDHMTHVLAVLASMSDEESNRFVHSCVFPSLTKMQRSLDDNESPYRFLIKSLTLLLEQMYGDAEPWNEDDVIKTHTTDDHPGQNGRRTPGQDDPLRAFPMPNAGCGIDAPLELVPLQMEYSKPENPFAGRKM